MKDWDPKRPVVPGERVRVRWMQTAGGDLMVVGDPESPGGEFPLGVHFGGDHWWVWEVKRWDRGTLRPARLVAVRRVKIRPSLVSAAWDGRELFVTEAVARQVNEANGRTLPGSADLPVAPDGTPPPGMGGERSDGLSMGLGR